MLDITEHNLGVIRGDTARPSRESDDPPELLELLKLKADQKRKVLTEVKKANVSKPPANAGAEYITIDNRIRQMYHEKYN
jgi:hypothetical protein